MNIRQVIRDHLDGLDSYTIPIEADRVADIITDDEFAAWAIENKRALIAQQMRDIDRSIRSTARHAVPRQRFASAAEKLASGEIESNVFRSWFVVDDAQTRKHLGQTVGADHIYIAAQHGLTANEALFEQSFHRAVAKKIGKRILEDVMTEAEYLALRASLTKRLAA